MKLIMVKTFIFKLLVLLCLCASVNPVRAQLVESLYSASTPVATQSTAERNAAIKRVFASVLIKISGQSDIVDNKDINKAITSALSYVTTFNFETHNGQLQLIASFNESSVDALLKQSSISIWGNQRPTAMLWLAHEGEQHQRLVVSDDSANTTGIMVKNQAQARGMPMLLPLWDLDDQFSVTASEVWGLFSDSIALANARYATDYMVLAKVSEYGLNQQLNWAIYKQNPLSHDYREIVASGLDEFVDYPTAIKALVDQTTDFFARQYSVDTSGETGLTEFVVTNIDSIGKYVKVSDYLSSLKSLESLQLVANQQQTFTFRAKLLGNEQALKDVLQLEKRLVEQYSFELNASTYVWVK